MSKNVITIIKVSDCETKISEDDQPIEKSPSQPSEFDDPFTLKLKELGIDWGALEEGAAIEIDRDRKTIKLGEDFLNLSQDDLVARKTLNQLVDIFEPDRRPSLVDDSINLSDVFPSA